MKEKIKEYLEKLEVGICDYMRMPITERSTTALKSMTECYEHMKDLEKLVSHSEEFTREIADNWLEDMENDDGTKGAHWTIDETTQVAEDLKVKFDHINNYCWNVAMNMMYSDYCKVAEDFGVNTPEFFGEMAKAFLFDKDAKSPKDKMLAYYYGIVEND